jgi:putative transposase
VVGAARDMGAKRFESESRFSRCKSARMSATSQAMDLWAYQNGVKIDFSRPGKPTDNAFVESFNGTLRAECLNAHWFETLAGARRLIEVWRQEYNESRPHRSLGERTPSEFASQFAASSELTAT